MMWLGVAYLNGDGIPRDDVTGASWIRKAAELGDVDGARMMGQIYLTGRGVAASDLDVSRAWLQRAIARGDKEAAKLLAQINAAEQIDRARAVADDDDDD